MAGQLIFTLYTVVDGIFVARGVSETALAAVSIATPFVTLLFAISITFAGYFNNSCPSSRSKPYC